MPCGMHVPPLRHGNVLHACDTCTPLELLATKLELDKEPLELDMEPLELLCSELELGRLELDGALLELLPVLVGPELELTGLELLLLLLVPIGFELEPCELALDVGELEPVPDALEIPVLEALEDVAALDDENRALLELKSGKLGKSLPLVADTTKTEITAIKMMPTVMINEPLSNVEGPSTRVRVRVGSIFQKTLFYLILVLRNKFLLFTK